MADIFDEVNEDLRAERAQRFLLRYGGLAAAAVVLVVAGVGAWQGWQWYQNRQAGTVAETYFTAMRAAAAPGPAGQPGDRNGALTRFDQVAAQGRAGYRTLARLWIGALQAEGAKPDQPPPPAALQTWDQLAADDAAEPLLRDVARLLWITRQIDTADPPTLLARLTPLLDPTNPFHTLAEEQQALLALRTGQPDDARAVLRRLAQDVTAPQGVRGRANGLLTRLGG